MRIHTFLLFMIIVSGLLAGCQGTDSSQNTEPVSTKIPAVTEKPASTASGEPAGEETMTDTVAEDFVIKNGRLVRYKAGYFQSKNIVLPKTVKEIAPQAFELTKEEKKNISKLVLSKISIPADIKIEEKAFEGAGPLDISMENGRKKITKYAFYNIGKYGCESTVKLSRTIKKIDDYGLYSEGGLEVLSYDSLEEIGRYGMNGAKFDHLPPGIRILGAHAIGENDILQDGFPESLEKIGKECISISNGKIKISANVKKIGLNAVQWDYYNASDRGYIVDPANKYYRSDKSGWLYSKDGKKLYFAYRGLKTFEAPEGVEIIYRYGIYELADDDPDVIRFDGKDARWIPARG